MTLKSIQFFLLNAVAVSAVGLAQDKAVDPFSDEAQQEIAEELAEGTVYLEPGQISKLTKSVNQSVVTVIQRGRGGMELGTGAGFVISKDGLIATNLHVVGQGRDVTIEFQNGETRNATAIHAWDRHHDLAVVKIDSKDLDLKPLKMADSDKVTQGQIIVGFGAPRGLKFSVVSGVISAIRKLEEDFLDGDGETPDYPMLQIAMPIEQGNSGGPIVNLDGEVVGLVTLKHTQTENLGFAVRINDLKPLLEKPNSTPMASWKTIGVLSPREWTPVMGANWTQNGGTIQVTGLGSGFGGRSLCLSEETSPEGDFELAVKVKLDDETGAAGLVFSSNGDDIHYGFYPTNGQVRLTRFEGPTVNSWKILSTFDTDTYKPGEWNRLRISFTGDTITGYINGEQVLELDDMGGLGAKGKVGLCKFRGTTADFKQFAVGTGLAIKPVDEPMMAKLGAAIDAFAASSDARNDAVVKKLSDDTEISSALLDKKAAELEARAEELRKLKSSLHVARVAKNIRKILDEDEVNLFAAGIQIAWIDNPELDVDYFHRQLSYLAEDAKKSIGKKAKTDREKVDGLRKFLFEESGFHGARGDQYYIHKNSYLDHVIEYREGLPITLSVVFIELAKRLGISGVKGVPIPGHFMVGHYSKDEDDEAQLQLIDVFDGGKTTEKEEMQKMTRAPDELFEPAKSRDIVIRMLRNLINIEVEVNQNPTAAIAYIDLIVALDPESGQERFQRAILRIQEKDRTGAEEDLDWLLENRPPGIDYDRLKQFRDNLDEIMKG